MAADDRPILILEDDALIALDLEDTLREAGFDKVATTTAVREALALLVRVRPAAAILDFDIGRETSVPVAHRLGELGVPLLFLTGSPDRARAAAPQAPVLTKPAPVSLLKIAMAQLIALRNDGAGLPEAPIPSP